MTKLALGFQGESDEHPGHVVISETTTYKGNTYPVTNTGNEPFVD